MKRGLRTVLTKRKTAVATAALALSIVTGASINAYLSSDVPPTGMQDTTKQNAANSLNIRWKIGADGKQATSGTSHVLSDTPSTEVRLRARPSGPAQGAHDDGGVIDYLPDRTQVTMRCWRDGGPPAEKLSPRWFWVAEVSSPHPGVTGYIWADLVWNQIRVPECDNSLTVPGDPLKNSRVVLAKGASAGAEFYYDVRLERFPAGWRATVRCYDSRSDDPIKELTLVAGRSGTAADSKSCASGEGEHWVAVDSVVFDPAVPARGPLFSNKVYWSPPTPTRGPSPTPRITSPKPPPTKEPKGPDVTRVLTVYNRVTNGGLEMREDSTPTYLSSVTQPYCKRDGCALVGTDMWSGAKVSATCWVAGQQMTNGQYNSDVDDANPGLYTSTLWYGVRWSDGRYGYLPEIWVDPADRGAGGLSHC
jgi:hypothetical protein